MRSFEGSVIGHAYRRAAYTSEPTNAEAPIWAAYGLPIEYPEIVVPHRSAGLRLHQLPHRLPSLCTHRLPLHASPAGITSSSVYPRLDPRLHPTGTGYVYL